MTKEEYMAHTNIKSVEEAAQYLRNLHIFFVVASIGVLVNWIFVDYIDRPIRLLIILAIGVPFVIYSMKVIKAEKIVKTSAALALLFAPISWFWFYPGITDPLKIIIGKKQPPSILYQNLSDDEKKRLAKEGGKRAWRTTWITLGICSIIFIALTIILIYFG